MSATMSMLQADGLGLTALVFLLGLRHGFDPDHLVAIDGLTRCNRSRWNGLFFSLGHGVVVTLVGLAVALAAAEWQAPAWLSALGAWISISVLLVLGLANLVLLARTAGERPVPLVGLRGRWLSERLAGASHPALVAAIGAAFALSFDTISHALVFSLTGATMAGWLFATLLGLVFTLGMVLVDALNGLWVARMRGSRIVSAAIALLCLGIAAGAAVELEAPKPLLSAGSMVVLLAAYLLATRYGTGKTRPAG
jgi:nickel/cobalt transporter (NiCoT) family protein